MPQKCSHLTADGRPCGAYAMTGTKLCFMHSDTNRRADAVKKGGQLRAQQKLERAQQKLASALPGTIAVAQRAGLDASQIASLDTLEGLKRWSAYVSSLLLDRTITAVEAQALFAGGRLAKDVQSLINESRLLSVMEKRKGII